MSAIVVYMIQLSNTLYNQKYLAILTLAARRIIAGEFWGFYGLIKDLDRFCLLGKNQYEINEKDAKTISLSEFDIKQKNLV